MAQKAKKVASALIDIYISRQKPFILTQKEFQTLSDKGKMRTKFLHDVDALLRKRGYVLIDIHKEMHVIGVAHIEEVVQWDIPKMDTDTDKQPSADDNEHAPNPTHNHPHVPSASPQQSVGDQD